MLCSVEEKGGGWKGKNLLVRQGEGETDLAALKSRVHWWRIVVGPEDPLLYCLPAILQPSLPQLTGTCHPQLGRCRRITAHATPPVTTNAIRTSETLNASSLPPLEHMSAGLLVRDTTQTIVYCLSTSDLEEFLVQVVQYPDIMMRPSISDRPGLGHLSHSATA